MGNFILEILLLWVSPLLLKVINTLFTQHSHQNPEILFFLIIIHTRCHLYLFLSYSFLRQFCSLLQFCFFHFLEIGYRCDKFGTQTNVCPLLLGCWSMFNKLKKHCSSEWTSIDRCSWTLISTSCWWVSGCLLLITGTIPSKCFIFFRVAIWCIWWNLTLGMNLIFLQCCRFKVIRP